jgi:hypothetical protein
VIIDVDLSPTGSSSQKRSWLESWVVSVTLIRLSTVTHWMVPQPVSVVPSQDTVVSIAPSFVILTFIFLLYLFFTVAVVVVIIVHTITATTAFFCQYCSFLLLSSGLSYCFVFTASFFYFFSFLFFPSSFVCESWALYSVSLDSKVKFIFTAILTISYPSIFCGNVYG